MLEELMMLDGNILLWIQEYLRVEPLTIILSFITHLGDMGIIWIVISLLLLLRKGTRRAGMMSLISLALCFCVTNLFLKNLFNRIRPYEVVNGLELLIEKQKDFSFPSGHSASSFASAVVLYKTLPKRYGVIILGMAFIISLSRLYVGVHYPSDVIAGIMIGTITAIAVIMVQKRIFQSTLC
ncbi:MAG: phosphatase PAP2 family protein [Lachnospiraceae bacterium]